jgi:hypothetical protein
MKSAGLLVLFLAGLAASGGEAGTPPARAVRRAVEPRDFFVYGCVREFARAHALPLYDSSTGYAVEYGRMAPEEMSRIYDAAKTFAMTLRAPDPADEDHGGVPVLAQCLEESRSARVDALLRRKRKAKE